MPDLCTSLRGLAMLNTAAETDGPQGPPGVLPYPRKRLLAVNAISRNALRMFRFAFPSAAQGLVELDGGEQLIEEGLG
jgi:hypothetical protein